MKAGIRLSYMALVIVASVAAVSAQGCYTPFDRLTMDAAKASNILSANIRNNLGGLSDDLQFLMNFPLMQKIHAYTDGGTECSGGAILDPETREPTGLTDETCKYELSEQAFTVDCDEVAEDLIEMLDKYVFVDSQIESEGDSVMILLDPDVFCQMFKDEDGSDGFQMCTDLLTVVPIRLELYTYWDDAMYIDVLVGEDMIFATEIQFWSEGIYVTLDLDSMTAPLELINSLWKIDGRPPVDSFEASGYLGLYLSRDYYDAYTIRFDVSSRVQVSVERPEGSFGAEIETGTAYLRADGDLGLVDIVAALNDFEVYFPYQLFVDALNKTTDSPVDVNGTIRLRGDGIGFIATGDKAAGNMVVSDINLGTGPSVLMHDFDTLFGIELNPDDDGSFGLVLSQDGDGFLTAAVSGVIDLVMDWNMGLLADDLNEVPAGKGDETWRVSLVGSAPAFTLTDGVGDQWLKILSGTLTASSSAASEQTVTATEGQCVFAVDDQTHPVLSGIAAGECLPTM